MITGLATVDCWYLHKPRFRPRNVRALRWLRLARRTAKNIMTDWLNKVMLEQPVSVLVTADLQYPNSGYLRLDWVNAFRAATVRYPAAVQGTTHDLQVLSAFLDDGVWWEQYGEGWP